MKTIPNLILQKRLMLRLGAIIASGFTTLCSPLTVLASEASAIVVTSQRTPTLGSSSTLLIAQNEDTPIEEFQTKLLDSLFDYGYALASIRTNQSELVTYNSTDIPLQVPRTYNQPNAYFIVQVEYEGNSIGFVIRRSDFYIQGYIRNYNRVSQTGHYYYFNDATIRDTDVRQANQSTQLSVGSNYNNLLGGTFSRADFNLNDLRQSFRNLVNNEPNSNSVNIALVRFAVAISEAIRFNPVALEMSNLFNNSNARINFEEIHDQYLSHWSRLSNLSLNAPDSEVLSFYLRILSVALFIPNTGK